MLYCQGKPSIQTVYLLSHGVIASVFCEAIPKFACGDCFVGTKRLLAMTGE